MDTDWTDPDIGNPDHVLNEYSELSTIGNNFDCNNAPIVRNETSSIVKLESSNINML